MKSGRCLSAFNMLCKKLKLYKRQYSILMEPNEERDEFDKKPENLET